MIAGWLARLFPLWAILLSGIAYSQPHFFLPARDAITPLLMLVMLGMGLTLTAADFADVARHPRLVALGCLLHYTIMPVAAILIAKTLHLSPDYTVGMVLVGATSSGTASNVINYLAGGHVALAVSLTVVSTLLAVVLMPALTFMFVGATVPVPRLQMLLAVLQVAVAPIVLGMLLRRFFSAAVVRIQLWLPAISVAAICAIIAIIVALNKSNIASAGAVVLVAVVMHNLIGFALGYGLARLCRASVVDARTIAIEVGMQNSGLSVALALKFFAPAAALPGAVFSVWHNVSGSLLAAWWSRKPSADQ